ncbi:hypothetical protein ACUY3U_22780, partial [Gordonia amicalis]
NIHHDSLITTRGSRRSEVHHPKGRYLLVAATVVFDADDGTGPGQARRFRLRVLVTPDDGSLKLGAVQYLP